MAPFEWITAERIILLLFMALGVVSIYWGVTDPTPDNYLGVSLDIWLGIFWIIIGVVNWRTWHQQKDVGEDE